MYTEIRNSQKDKDYIQGEKVVVRLTRINKDIQGYIIGCIKFNSLLVLSFRVFISESCPLSSKKPGGRNIKHAKFSS